MTDIALTEAAQIISSLGQFDAQIQASLQGRQTIQQLLEQTDPDKVQLIAISQQLEGDLDGFAMLLLDDESSMLFIRQLLNEPARLRELTEMEEEALSEVGNIMINCCLSNYMQLLKGRVGSHLPQVTRGHFSQILKTFVADDKAAFRVDIQIEGPASSYQGMLIWTDLKVPGI